MTATTSLDIMPVTTVVGSVVEGVDITQPLTPEGVGQLREALRDLEDSPKRAALV